jgi:hypothetical protein
VKEEEWLASTDPHPMLIHLRTKQEHRSCSGRRKLRLFGCGCGRRVLRLMSERGRGWLEWGQRYAEGPMDREQRRQAGRQDFGPVDGQRADHLADMTAWYTLGPNEWMAAGAAARGAAAAIEIEAWHQRGDFRRARAAERGEQARLLRDLFGNPFRPPPSLSATVRTWNGGAVRRLAELAYAGRQLPSGHLDPGRLAVLADALEEAGLTDAGLLAHLRGPGPHCLGCHALDAILGKW